MASNLEGEWHALGDGKLHDPLIGHPAMKGRRWQIDYAHPPHGYEKMQQVDKETSKYKTAGKKIHTV